ncbi:hypothetical protein BDW02DRAFT_581282 [Decorospora gaudefroyi]|uniref:Uncharacterized protein n=1 Tax=Decorospora gaudefroyi TaxID=184978 RepID=A0A6A5K6C4_9PLEO|nr:hypothetical protein BDW02DRAFT_581282 [Decorospora gaudefroyi]
MDYYRCSTEDLCREARRRGFENLGTRDQVGESLKQDDDARESEATTVATAKHSCFVPQALNLSRTAEFGATVPTDQLLNEKIVYWTMNTFFSTLQLFFESGRSCTIDGGQLPNATIGLDPALRFKLTDPTHEEDGCVVNSILPRRFPLSGTGLVIKQALVAQRTSISVLAPDSSSSKQARIVTEVHTVVGLRLKGMERMAYVWAKRPAVSEQRTWGDVRVAGLRDDIPIPFVGVSGRGMKPGGQSTVVVKESLIAPQGPQCSRSQD